MLGIRSKLSRKGVLVGQEDRVSATTAGARKKAGGRDRDSLARMKAPRGMTWGVYEEPKQTGEHEGAGQREDG